MKTVQKLQIVMGAATFVSMVSYFCVYMLPLASFEYKNYGVGDFAIVLVGSLLTYLVPSAFTAIAAYLCAVNADPRAFVAVVTSASITAIVGLLLVLGVRFYSHDPVTTFLLLVPLIFSILAIVFAFRCRKVFLSLG